MSSFKKEKNLSSWGFNAGYSEGMQMQQVKKYNTAAPCQSMLEIKYLLCSARKLLEFSYEMYETDKGKS